eukprot:TRINITY_DN1628_c0_g1_i2.p1 TRINITY_DN1628_c0_g1~~TRINITY_DN1628_c0_g1_i2.p1  ORF type:complete len:282 (-),score=42.98 TRINITY_DN1628_c0_g1_i2:222-1067(-)
MLNEELSLVGEEASVPWLIVRRATSEDAEAIREVCHSVWKDTSSDRWLLERIQRVLLLQSDNKRITLVCVLDTRVVVGFVDGFSTRGKDAVEERWELDLLAVDPSYQRRGIASRLVSSFVEQSNRLASNPQADTVRALVAIDNIASQRTFQKCGFSTDGQPQQLMIHNRSQSQSTQQKHTSTTNNHSYHLIEVDTINYCGVWIEGATTIEEFEAPLSLLSQQQEDEINLVTPELIGAVIANNEATKSAASAGYEAVGTYQWWKRSLCHPLAILEQFPLKKN